MEYNLHNFMLSIRLERRIAEQSSYPVYVISKRENCSKKTSRTKTGAVVHTRMHKQSSNYITPQSCRMSIRRAQTFNNRTAAIPMEPAVSDDYRD